MIIDDLFAYGLKFCTTFELRQFLVIYLRNYPISNIFKHKKILVIYQ